MIDDPFASARKNQGVLVCPFQGEDIPMLLRHADVRAAAKNWQTFSNDAPFRVPIPSEEELRRMRQLPIETDPPVHAAYRDIVEPWFRRAKNDDVIRRVETLISTMLDHALCTDSIEIVRNFALPIQSRALTYLLGVEESEADLWISWGTHVFRDGDGMGKGMQLESYLRSRFQQAAGSQADDFFSALTKATFDGRPLTEEEMLGFGNLTFAGGRDTVIHMISCALHHLAQTPTDFSYLREDPSRIIHAGEELLRAFMPLTHIGRVCPVATEVHGATVPGNGRVSLCWASANMDETVFDSPQEVRLNRKPNPHLSFGFGDHLCLGAAHARLILRTLLRLCCEKISRIEIIDATPRTEVEPAYTRTLGYESLTMRMDAC